MGFIHERETVPFLKGTTPPSFDYNLLGGLIWKVTKSTVQGDGGGIRVYITILMVFCCK